MQPFDQLRVAIIIHVGSDSLTVGRRQDASRPYRDDLRCYRKTPA
jgi:hypothetical protein